MNFIGVDPGVNGAIVLLNGSRLTIWDTPITRVSKGKKTRRVLDEERLACLVDAFVDLGDAVVLIEQVGAMPGQGVTSMFNFGDIYGATRMAFKYGGFDYKLVRPAVWKLAMGCGANKESSLVACLDLFGDGYANQWFGPRQGILDGRCEAALLAEYCRRTYG